MERACSPGRTRCPPRHPSSGPVLRAGNKSPMVSTMARHDPPQPTCKESSLGVSLLYAHSTISRWRLDPPSPVAFGLRLGGTLHRARLRRHHSRRRATARGVQSRIRHLPAPAPATHMGCGPICSRRRARISNQLIVRMREESSPVRTWQAGVHRPGGSVGVAA